MAPFEIVTQPEQNAAVVRDELPMARLSELFDRAFHTVIAACDAQGVPVVGPPFGFYPRMPGETVEVAAGFPVARPITASGEVEPMVLPGGRMVRGVHVGPFESLGQTYEALMAWVGAQGLTLAEGMWETYLTDPSAVSDPGEWQTLILWPLREP
jgi:effector-binding domain-containing protein